MYDDKCSTAGLTIPEGAFPENMPLAMAYVPFQTWGNTYSENVALERGTIFEDLDYPFLGRKGAEKLGE